jgi:hypothetical protein
MAAGGSCFFDHSGSSDLLEGHLSISLRAPPCPSALVLGLLLRSLLAQRLPFSYFIAESRYHRSQSHHGQKVMVILATFMFHIKDGVRFQLSLRKSSTNGHLLLRKFCMEIPVEWITV